MATFDRRRIQAPEGSTPLTYDSIDQNVAAVEQDIFIKTGLVTQANGSAYIESGRVKVACSVYGPRPKAPPYSPQGSLNVEVKFAPFASDPRRAPLRDTEPASLSTLVTQLLLPSLQLDQLPKSSIDVFLMVLEADSTSRVLEAALSAASSAVADAGIPMNGLTVGSTVYEPIQVTLGMMPALGRVTSMWMTGMADIDVVARCTEQAVLQSKTAHGVIAQALLEGADGKI